MYFNIVTRFNELRQSRSYKDAFAETMDEFNLSREELSGILREGDDPGFEPLVVSHVGDSKGVGKGDLLAAFAKKLPEGHSRNMATAELVEVGLRALNEKK
jgi:hypothetical protein